MADQAMAPGAFRRGRQATVAEFGAGLVCVGSRADLPLAAAFRVALGPLPVLDLSGQTTLLQLAALNRGSGPLRLQRYRSTSLSRRRGSCPSWASIPAPTPASPAPTVLTLPLSKAASGAS